MTNSTRWLAPFEYFFRLFLILGKNDAGLQCLGSYFLYISFRSRIAFFINTLTLTSTLTLTLTLTPTLILTAVTLTLTLINVRLGVGVIKAFHFFAGMGGAVLTEESASPDKGKVEDNLQGRKNDFSESTLIIWGPAFMLGPILPAMLSMVTVSIGYIILHGNPIEDGLEKCGYVWFYNVVFVYMHSIL